MVLVWGSMVKHVETFRKGELSDDVCGHEGEPFEDISSSALRVFPGNAIYGLLNTVIYRELHWFESSFGHGLSQQTSSCPMSVRVYSGEHVGSASSGCFDVPSIFEEVC